MSARVLFYVQHLLGMGHVYRARRICDGLHGAGLAVTLVTGGEPVPVLRDTPYPCIQLPPIRAASAGFDGLVTANGEPIDDTARNARREALLTVARDVAPNAAIIEAFPFARRQMRFELLPLLEHLNAAGDTVVLSSVRDILQENRKAGRAEETAGWLNQHFDGVLVHGDKRLVQLADTFPRANLIAVDIHYTGLVAPPAPQTAGQRTNEVLVTAGGGAVGAALLAAAAQAARDPGLSHLRWVLSTGPNMPDEDAARLRSGAPGNVTVVPFIDALPQRLATCALSVSQAGYNTVADILVAGCASVLVPFATGGETEQTRRAEALADAGRCMHLAEADLDAATLAEAAHRAMSAPVAEIDIDLNGSANTAALVKNLLSRTS